ncbi:MAG: tetratricopeptide repeat protein, partial [Limisphaerales bacterium]
NHEFGYAWDRNLTDADAAGEFGPYIEIMAGVYTDNQPDFSFLQPGETKSWSQYWYPIQKIGPAQTANLDAAASLRLEKRKISVGIAVTEAHAGAVVSLSAKGKMLGRWTRDLSPALPFTETVALPHGVAERDCALSVCAADGRQLIAYQPGPVIKANAPPPATEPPAPEEIAHNDELFITGLHLEQYRHATRMPTLYWLEALRRDPLDSRCNNAMGLWHLRRGEFATAETYFRKAIQRLTRRNANPYDGEAFYNLGLCLRYLERPDEAYDSFYKATWNLAWAAAGFHALAEIDCLRRRWSNALDHIGRSLQFDTNNLRARNLKTKILRKLDLAEEAEKCLRRTVKMDPLDGWARDLQGGNHRGDLQARLDLAHDYARSGFLDEAIAVLKNGGAAAGDLPDQNWGAAPLLAYTLGWLLERAGDKSSARKQYRRAAALSPDYCFPSRLEEIAILEAAMRINPEDARAPYYLGNLLYDRRRHKEALALWQRSAKLDRHFSVVWRNLGIGFFNVSGSARKARAAYENAFRANPRDARLLYERDQLWKRMGEKPARRLAELEKHLALVAQRDDLSVEICALYNQTGRHEKAARIIRERNFQPWEGGEGGPLGQHTRAQLGLGRGAMVSGDFFQALEHFQLALTSPSNLGEARHLLANQSDVHFRIGEAFEALGRKTSARAHWLEAASFKGDFQEMRVRDFSEMTYY